MQHLSPRRDFNPTKTIRYGRPTFTPDKLVKYSPKWGYSRMFHFPYTGSHWRPRMHTVVVGIDGASKVNDRSSSKTKGSYGIYFGPKSPHNKHGRVVGKEQTNPYSELEAVRVALETVIGMQEDGVLGTFHFNEIILKTNSTYIHDTFNTWIWDYVQNGFERTNGKPAAHPALIQKIHDIICEMEQRLNLAVRFWLVGKEWNADADNLAQVAFREAGDDIGEDRVGGYTF